MAERTTGTDINTLIAEVNNGRLWQHRRDAAYALEKLKDAAAVEALIAALGDESHYVRMAVVRALGKIGDGGAVTALTGKMQDDQEMALIRYSAMWALGEIGADAEQAIDAIKPFTEIERKLPERDYMIKDLAATTIEMIELAVAEKNQPAAEEAARDDEGAAQPAAKKGGLTPEERQAKREAALARKRARQEAENKE